MVETTNSVWMFDFTYSRISTSMCTVHFALLHSFSNLSARKVGSLARILISYVHSVMSIYWHPYIL